jgi:predicted nucleotide-binding protein
MEMGNESNLLTELETLRKELKSYKKILYSEKELSDSQKRYRESLREKLVEKSGALRQTIENLTHKQFIKLPMTGEVTTMWAEGLSTFPSTYRSNSLNICIDATNEAIGKLKSDIKNGIRDEQGNLTEKPPIIDTEPPKAFIAHEGMTRALDKVKSFLDALRIKYLIAEIEPSDGRVVERQVQWTQGQADFAVILATKGKVINKNTGEPYMGMNVADELGRAREVFKNRIILLLQRGVEPHTNVSGIVYEPFSPQNMEKAFVKIARELANWGYLKAVRIEGVQFETI